MGFQRQNNRERIVGLVPGRGSALRQPGGTTLKQRNGAILDLKSAVRDLLIIAGAVVMLLPFFWMLATAFKTPDQVLQVRPTFIPRPATLANFPDAWNKAPWGRYFANSVIVAITAVGLSLLTSSLAGYAFAKLRFPGRDIIFIALLSTLMIPFEVTMATLYTLMVRLSWVDTLTGIIVPAASSAMGTFLMRQFLVTLPDDLLDAARIDGAGEFGIFWRIALPLSKPVLVTFGLLQFIDRWGDYLWPLILINSDVKRTLPLGLAAFMTSSGLLRYGSYMAASIFVLLPIVILFLATQRYVIKGIVMTGFKA